MTYQVQAQLGAVDLRRVGGAITPLRTRIELA